MHTKSEQIGELAQALSKAQSELTAVAKDKKGYGYKYATLDGLIENIRQPLASNGLSYTQMPSMSADGRVQIETLVMHSSGQWVSSVCEAPADNGKQMNAVQGVGSTITYLRRYSLASVFGVPFGDDNDAQRQAPTQRRQAPARQAPPPPQQPQQAKQPESDAPTQGDFVNPALLNRIHKQGGRVYGNNWTAKKDEISAMYGVETSNEWPQKESLALFLEIKAMQPVN
jgi:hypothetical protein